MCDGGVTLAFESAGHVGCELLAVSIADHSASGIHLCGSDPVRG